MTSLHEASSISNVVTSSTPDRPIAQLYASNLSSLVIDVGMRHCEPVQAHVLRASTPAVAILTEYRTPPRARRSLVSIPLPTKHPRSAVEHPTVAPPRQCWPPVARRVHHRNHTTTRVRARITAHSRMGTTARVHHCTRVTAHACMTTSPPMSARPRHRPCLHGRVTAPVCTAASPPPSARLRHRLHLRGRVTAPICAAASPPTSAQPRHCPRLRGCVTARVRTTTSVRPRHRPRLQDRVTARIRTLYLSDSSLACSVAIALSALPNKEYVAPSVNPIKVLGHIGVAKGSKRRVIPLLDYQEHTKPHSGRPPEPAWCSRLCLPSPPQRSHVPHIPGIPTTHRVPALAFPPSQLPHPACCSIPASIRSSAPLGIHAPPFMFSPQQF
ncbi:hypothetical protein BC826DRAFT_1110753 [Russula brevipes]|nr:hypothetical protein BC826DRAFT_1110753 [Russula brevipes]